MWENCKRRSLQADARICRIYENRSRVLGEIDKGLFAKRLGDIVEVSRLNGWHLPVRDLLALASNMIVGHANPKEAKEGLMACSDVAKIQEKADSEASKRVMQNHWLFVALSAATGNRAIACARLKSQPWRGGSGCSSPRPATRR